MSLGYTAKECRLALRQTRNNVELALIYLEEKKGIREKDHERWRLEQQGKYLQVERERELLNRTAFIDKHKNSAL